MVVLLLSYMNDCTDAMDGVNNTTQVDCYGFTLTGKKQMYWKVPSCCGFNVKLLHPLSSGQVGGAVVRGAHQGADTPGTPVFPEHQAYQLPHQPAASGGQQLSAGLLHRAGRSHPARGKREAHAGPLQDAHHRH